MMESNWRKHISPEAVPHQVVAAVQVCVSEALAGLGDHGITVQVEIPAAGVIAVKVTRNDMVEPAAVEVQRLRQMLADAFGVYPNLDLDIEAMRRGGA